MTKSKTVLLSLAWVASLSCAPEVSVIVKPQDATRVWHPSFVGTYFETQPSPLFAQIVGRQIHAADPFWGTVLARYPALQLSVLRTGGRTGISRPLLDRLWRYTTADSIVFWQIWCDDGAAEDEESEINTRTTTQRRMRRDMDSDQRENLDAAQPYTLILDQGGAPQSMQIPMDRLGLCTFDRDRFDVFVLLYKRGEVLPAVRLKLSQVLTFSGAVNLALAEFRKRIAVGGWTGWNWTAAYADAAARQ